MKNVTDDNETPSSARYWPFIVGVFFTFQKGGQSTTSIFLVNVYWIFKNDIREIL